MKENRKITIFEIIAIIVCIGFTFTMLTDGIVNGINGLSNRVTALSNALEVDNDLRAMDIGEAAHYLNISKEDLQKLIDDPKSNIPYIKIGDKTILYDQALNQWLKTARITID